ncbi:hypothetical protein BDK51DRAFT_47288 [Blyttiomyces helicus]|uniref:Uncharacterized protein n=1 Tax=Blyttiomyces helicus TaxID=388810 RepID=A0A4P9W0B6_9FUNG|nr:hypothetical protein BDK51DRAFT_47288 [Blyttiomyces helicus]|eukprot:RKO85559.1 hypothetical protein BDK51DRAFT_47288 [Blyttiomyces helicus]
MGRPTSSLPTSPRAALRELSAFLSAKHQHSYVPAGADWRRNFLARTDWIPGHSPIASASFPRTASFCAPPSRDRHCLAPSTPPPSARSSWAVPTPVAAGFRPAGKESWKIYCEGDNGMRSGGPMSPGNLCKGVEQETNGVAKGKITHLIRTSAKTTELEVEAQGLADGALRALLVALEAATAKKVILEQSGFAREMVGSRQERGT